jgi:hypothetical protein
MASVRYTVVEHDGGWAYRVGGIYSETFPTREDAHAGAEAAAERQRLAGETTDIEYEDAAGHWRHELSRADDRPDVVVDDGDPALVEDDGDEDDQPLNLSRDVGAEEPLPDGPRR